MSLPVNLYYRNELGTLINLKTARDVNLEMTWDEHGDNTANFQICDWAGKLPKLDTPVWAVDPTYGVFWSGYAGQPRIGGFFGGASKLTARGWRYTIIEDGWDTEKKFAAGTPLINLVFDALSICHNIGGGIPFPGGLTTTQLPEDSPDFSQQTPENVFEFVRNVFNYLNTPLIWQIKNNPLTPFADQPSLEMKFQDTAPRYKVRLTKNDVFDPGFDGDIIWNAASVGYADGLVADDQAPVGSLYSVIDRIRKKRVNANADIKGTTTAQALVNYLISRNNTLRPVTSTLELHCDTKVQAEYPATPAGTVANWPHHLIRPHFSIRILNSTSNWGQYKGIVDWYIIDVKHNFESKITTLTLGDPIVYEAFKLLQSYITSRSNVGIDSSVVNEPLRDADIVPVYGPTGDGSLPAMTGEGSPIFALDPLSVFNNPTDQLYLPHGAAVHPTLQYDYGVQANFGREADRIGVKGFIKVIPCKILNWSMWFTAPAGSDVVPTDSIQVQLYPTYPFVVGTDIIVTCILSAQQGLDNQPIAVSPESLQIFAQGGKIGVRVSSAASTAGCGFQIGVGGRKLFPDAGVTN